MPSLLAEGEEQHSEQHMLVLAQEGSRIIIMLHGKEQALCPGGFFLEKTKMLQKSQKPHYHVPGKRCVESQNQHGGSRIPHSAPAPDSRQA